jgi:hypothetical protein
VMPPQLNGGKLDVRMSSDVATRVAGAFPATCARDVAAVFATLSPAKHAPTSDDVAPIVVRGESVRIPARVYFPEPSPAKFSLLTAREKLVAQCLFTRHHDGFLRERMVRPLLAQAAFWTLPFVVQLLGEHVIEIVHVLEEQLRPGAEIPYAEFLNENPVFWQRTRSRVVSYWNCYHRREFPSLGPYPGQRVVDRLENWRTQGVQRGAQKALEAAGRASS